MTETNLLEARRLTKIFDHRKVVDEVSLRVNRGEIVGLLGSDHSGKTAMLQMLRGDLKPDGGSVRLLGSVLAEMPSTLTCSGPSILILDEPFTGISPESSEVLRSRIFRLAGQGVGVLFSGPAQDNALGWCDRAYILDEGRVMASGSSSGLLSPQ